MLFIDPPTSRILFDQEFLDAGCPIELYDETREVDDTVGTYLTNFLITVLCILASWKLQTSSPASNSTTPMKVVDPLMSIGFFLSTAVTYFVAGIGHIIIKRETETLKSDIILYLTFSFNSLSVISLVLYALKIVGITRTSTNSKKRNIWWITTIILCGALICFVALKLTLAFAAMNSISFLLMIAVYLYDSKCNFDGILKAVAILSLVGSWIVQIILTPVCDKDGYIDCFKDCPFPNPGTFNHNGLFHLLYAAGLMFLAWAEDRSRGKGRGYTHTDDVDAGYSAIAASNFDDEA